jgi:hypothetical protein
MAITMAKMTLNNYIVIFYNIMFLSKKFVRIHKINFAIMIFVAMLSIIHIYKPAIMYNEEGGFRPFGIGYKHKTVIPIWVASIILAIFSYLAVLYYLMFT